MARSLNMDKPLRFHWSLSQAGDRFRRTRSTLDMPGVLDLNEQVRVCEMAEQCGIESMLMAIGFTRPDPTLLSIAIGKRTRTMKFMIACRSGLISPLYFVQQINTASQLIGGRLCINIVCGHTPHELKYYGDHLSHDERYERTSEFLTICRALWRGERDVGFEGPRSCARPARKLSGGFQYEWLVPAVSWHDRPVCSRH